MKSLFTQICVSGFQKRMILVRKSDCLNFLNKTKPVFNLKLNIQMKKAARKDE
jgi:hypothetical protein